MNSGLLTWTCLLCCLGQVGGSSAWCTNDRHFRIPVDISAAERQEIKTLYLHWSRDRGHSWEQIAAIAPTEPGFTVHAPTDGEYWFRVAVLSKQDKMDPADIFKEKDERTHKIIVDTLRPNVRLVSAQRQGEDVLVRWEIQESHPDVKSMKLRYRPTNSAADWSEPVPLKPGPVGEVLAKVNTGNALTFRLEIKDLAGNFHFDEKAVAGTVSLAHYQANPHDASAKVIPPPVHSAAPPVNHAAPPGSPTKDKDEAKLPPLPPAPPTPPVAMPGNPMAQQVVWGTDDPGAPKVLPPDAPNKVPQPVATTASGNYHHQVGFAPGAMAVPKPRTLPPLQIVNDPEVVLQYELNRVGPAGIGSVELWVTRNDGQTWEGWLKDPTVDASMKGGKYKRTLQLPGEGVYGLNLVVRNKAGVGKEPVNGDAPEMRIEVDTTSPEAVLFKPEPDPMRRDALLIMWEAKDKNLTSQPITLEWAQEKNGPWNTIQANLPNTGRHSWQLPPGVPVYVYLRVRVRDRAGNEGIAATDQPQLADTSEPEGKLIGVSLTPAEKN
jgi:hypothetical protein